MKDNFKGKKESMFYGVHFLADDKTVPLVRKTKNGL